MTGRGTCSTALVDARLLTSYEPRVDGRRGRRPAPHRDRARVAAHGMAAPGALADAGPGRRAAARSAAPGGAAVGSARQARRPAVDRARRSASTSSGASAIAGTLSEAENTFARAMTARAARRRLQRRAGAGALIAASLSVAIGMSVLWRQSERARAEASRRGPTRRGAAALRAGTARAGTPARASPSHTRWRAWSTRTHPHARLLALRALSAPRPALRAGGDRQAGPGPQPRLLPDGRWLANVEQSTGTVRLWGERRRRAA